MKNIGSVCSRCGRKAQGFTFGLFRGNKLVTSSEIGLLSFPLNLAYHTSIFITFLVIVSDGFSLNCILSVPGLGKVRQSAVSCLSSRYHIDQEELLNVRLTSFQGHMTGSHSKAG